MDDEEEDDDYPVRECGDCGNVRSLEWIDCETALCGECIDKRDQTEQEREKRREERVEKIQQAWLAAGGVCSARPFGFRQSGSASCTHKLLSLDELCECQTCEDCGQPHNTGREEFAEDECQCLAGP